jgi:hypothetical protein
VTNGSPNALVQMIVLVSMEYSSERLRTSNSVAMLAGIEILINPTANNSDTGYETLLSTRALLPSESPSSRISSASVQSHRSRPLIHHMDWPPVPKWLQPKTPSKLPSAP